MVLLRTVAAVSLALALPATAITLADVAAELRASTLDPDTCYRVRDLNFTRGADLRFSFTDGFLILGKPVAGRRVAAVFVADSDNGDAELLILPPNKAERMSLSAFTGSPTLDEHFRSALMLFTDDSAEVLLAEISRRGMQKAPDRGLLFADEWNNILGNISGSFSIRIIQHLAAGLPPKNGIFYAAVQGRKIGNFDTSYDPENPDQIYVGQLKYNDTRAYYDTWLSFPARGARTPPSPDFSVSNYRMEAALDAESKLSVHTRVRVKAERGPLNVLAFDITDGMSVKSATVDGTPAGVFTREALRANLIRRNESVLFLVTPAQPLDAGKEYEFEFEHEGSVVRHAGRDVYFVSSRSNWYPQPVGFARGSFATFDIRFTYPAHLQIVFAGDLKEDRQEGTKRITRRVTPTPIRTAGFNLGKYESVKAMRGNLTVELFANKQVEFALRRAGPDVVVLPPPMPTPFPRRGSQTGAVVLNTPIQTLPDPTARLQQMAGEIAAALEYQAGFLGPPALPSLMVSPIPGAFGQGFPGLVYLSTMAYLQPADRPQPVRNSQQTLFFDEILHAHETAHQWWGNVVTSSGPQDDWLQEALANYTALMYIEKKKGARTLHDVLGQYRDRLVSKTAASGGEERAVDSAGPIRLGARLESSLLPGAWRDIVYGKGSWIIHMLRRRMGDAAFLKFLGALVEKHRFRSLNVRGLQELAAAYLPPRSADPKLEAFFDHWVDNTGIPTFAMSTSMRGKAPALKLEIIVKQSGVDPASSFVVPVEVTAVRGGRPAVYWVTTGEDPVTIAVPLRAPPVKVALDSEGSVLATKR